MLASVLMVVAAVQPTPPAAWRNISTIRGMAIVAMTLNHAINLRVHVSKGLSGAAAEMTLWEELFQLIARALTHQCVSVFLFVSGYMMFRFSKTWQAAWANARNVATRYLLWCSIIIVMNVSFERKLDLWRTAVQLVTVGPGLGTYWFLVLIFQLFLIVPLLVKWVDKSPRTALAAIVVLQLIASARYYWAIGHGGAASQALIFRCPFFFAGMWVSAHWSKLVGPIMSRRGSIVILTVLSQVLIVLEIVALGWKFHSEGRVPALFGDETISMVIGSYFVISLLLTMQNTKTKTRAMWDWLGNNSMAILLAGDVVVMLALRVIWHAGELFGLPKPVPGIPPNYFNSIWVMLIFFIAGTFGPMAIAEISQRWFNARVRRVLFG